MRHIWATYLWPDENEESYLSFHSPCGRVHDLMVSTKWKHFTKGMPQLMRNVTSPSSSVSTLSTVLEQSSTTFGKDGEPFEIELFKLFFAPSWNSKNRVKSRIKWIRRIVLSVIRRFYRSKSYQSHSITSWQGKKKVIFRSLVF